MANIFQESITPDKPKVLEGERVYVYVPRATLDTPGIASYDSKDFILNNGKVHLAKDIAEEIEKHNINTNAHKEVFNTKVDKVAVYRDNKWVGSVNNNDGIAVALSTSYHTGGSETLGVTAGASVVAQNKYAWLNAYDEENNSRAYLEPDYFRVETKTPGEASYTTLLKVDKNSIQFKNDKVATETDVDKKVNIVSQTESVGTTLPPMKGEVINNGMVGLQSTDLNTGARKGILVNPSSVSITTDGVTETIATENYVDNKSTADRLYTDTKITEVKKAVPYAFDTLMNFIDWLAGNYIREDDAVPSDLNIGDDILIVEDGVPDYWVKSKSTPMTIDNFAPYESGDYKPTITWLEG